MGTTSEKKRKRKEDDDGADVINAQLAAYGERFMQMFDSTEVDTRTKSYPSPHESSDDSDIETSLDQDSSSEEESQDGANDWNDAADVAVEQIFNRSKKMPPPSQTGTKRSVKTINKASIRPPPPHLSEDIEKMERKRFMSHRAGVVSGAIPIGSPSSGKKARKSEANGNSLFDSSGKLSKEEFQKLTREVHLYGATALDKKSRKQFDAAVLEGLGAKKAKAVKMPAKMAIGMAKKRAKREAVALEEAIASGMVQKKGLGKKKRAEKKAGLDRGLMEDGGAFRNGVLKIGKIGSGSSGGKGGGGGGGGSGKGRGGGGKSGGGFKRR